MCRAAPPNMVKNTRCKYVLSLTENLKILSNLVENLHRIGMHKFSWAVTQTTNNRKEKIRM